MELKQLCERIVADDVTVKNKENSFAIISKLSYDAILQNFFR